MGTHERVVTPPPPARLFPSIKNHLSVFFFYSVILLRPYIEDFARTSNFILCVFLADKASRTASFYRAVCLAFIAQRDVAFPPPPLSSSF